ncbi:MFS transporter [Streptomyces sp. NPDC003717]|uniref:MFS transporter n=1 Tax=Streptomyces sp. NPDC003717 TaxID=3154276 RepID=UPI0033B351BA
MSTPSPRPSYAAVLRVPHARRTFASALVGRLSYGTVSLSVLLSVNRSTGSYAVAGTVMALFGATSVFLSPGRAALLDRYGPRRALIPMALLYAALLCALAVVCRSGEVSVPVLAVTAALAGACTPPLGPTMRAVWAGLLPDRALLQRAYSLDGVCEELLFVSGPLLVGVLIRFAPPEAGVVLSALLVTVGAVAFGTSPAVRAGSPRAEAAVRGGRPAFRALRRPVAVAAAAGLAVGAVELLVVAFAERHGLGDGAVAWTLAAMSAGSAVGGLVSGAVAWRRPARVRLRYLAAGLGLSVAATGLAPAVFVPAVACVGLFVAPLLTTAYLIVDESVSASHRIRAGAWVNTAVNAGSSTGAATAGLLTAHVPLALCFTAAGALAVATALTPTRRAAPHSAEPAPNALVVTPSR